MQSFIRRVSAVTILVSAMLASAPLAGHAQAPSQPVAASSGATYVLVHGAFENHAVWDAVAAGLRDAGQRVFAIDLPGRDGPGHDDDALTLDHYRDAVEACVSQLQGPVILVGHSFGGITISNLAEQHPEQVRTLVYLAALLPKDGDSAMTLSRADKANGIAPGSLSVSEDHRWGRMLPADPAARLALFCGDCNEAQAKRLEGGLVAEPIEPLRTPVHVSAERFGRVDKVYLATDDDRMISPSAQRAMLAATPVRKVVHLPTAHLPFLSRPAAVVQALLHVED